MTEHKCHPGVAAVLSFIVNGLGHLYIGEIKKGLFIISLSAAGMFVVILSALIIGFNLYKGMISSVSFFAAIAAFFIGILLLAIVGIYSILDAYKKASQI